MASKNSKHVYIHIPFCEQICTYCDFCKVIYDKKWIKDYLISLKKEIKENYKGEPVSTIYIGGGTPNSLDINELTYLLDIINIFNKDELEEFTIECNPKLITEEQLLLLKKYGVDRISLGVQSFNNNNLKFLGRLHDDTTALNSIILTKKHFDNINVDLMYGLPNQSVIDLENDMEQLLNLGITHISTYSLIIEPHTDIFIRNIKNINEDLDSDMYNLIVSKLKENKYEHYEVSNFCKTGYESKHNLCYWNLSDYYGFGLGVHGYINGTRYENTRSINEYLKSNYLLNEIKLSSEEIMEEYFILGLRKLEGINETDFFNKFQTNLEDIFNVKHLKYMDGYYFISGDKIYIMNEIIVRCLT